jgi:exoribonuclease II
VTELLIPLRVQVGTLTTLSNGDIDVELVVSSARHTLRRDHPAFNQLLAQLQFASDQRTAVWVTETPETHEIVDVRPAR